MKPPEEEMAEMDLAVNFEEEMLGHFTQVIS
jgi:hypothetical protein